MSDYPHEGRNGMGDLSLTGAIAYGEPHCDNHNMCDKDNSA